MLFFYKIEDGKLRIGSGFKIPLGMTEYTKGDESKELLDILDRDRNSTMIQKKREKFNNAIQTHLDTKAKEFRYDNMMSARSYAGYENSFQEEALKLATWGSECWTVAGEIEADVKAGNREMPTIDEVLTELPAY